MAEPPHPPEHATAAEFEAVAMEYLGALYRKAHVLIGNSADAADLVQETYLRAFRTFGNFKPGTNCRAWLFTILYSIFTNRYRKRRREPTIVSLDELEETHGCLLADDGAGAELAALTGAEIKFEEPELAAALGRLPAEFRAAVLLVDVEELSYEEAAVVMDCPVGTLRSRLFRARRALFVELRDYALRMGIIDR